MAETKQDALFRFRKALQAREDGLLTDRELARIRSEVLEVDGVKLQNIKDMETAFRDRLVKNGC